jgi:4a-hydroxytetrahydrobiopterin dehydratase
MAETPYDATTISQRLKELPEWTFRDGAIRRSYQTDGWRVTMLVVNAIAWVCEAADHHPDLAVSWARVEVALNTHSAKGITGRDFETAALIEGAVRWTPGEQSTLRRRPDPLVR